MDAAPVLFHASYLRGTGCSRGRPEVSVRVTGDA